MPAVSVVIPLYNKGPFVERAIRSVLAQTFQDFEIVVVNDGSTDDGPEVVAAIADSRIRLPHQANAGVSAARNRGIAEARADLIAFLDADDEWMPEFLSTIIRLKGKFPHCGVFATRYWLAYGDGRSRPAILHGIRGDSWEGVLADYYSAASRGDPPLCASAVAATRMAILSVGGFPVGISAGEDLLTWARLAASFEIAFSSRPQAVFHLGPVERSGILRRRPDRDDAVGQGLQALACSCDRRLRPSLLRYISQWHKMRASVLLRANETGLAIRHCIRGLRACPLNARLYAYLLISLLPGSLGPSLFRALLDRRTKALLKHAKERPHVANADGD